MKKLAIFDLDGTLVDTEYDMWFKCEAKTFEVMGYEPNQKLFEDFVGHNTEDISDMIREYNPNISVEEYWKELRKQIFDYIEEGNIPIMPGVFDLLNHLKEKNVTCCVASSSDYCQVVGVLKSAHLYDYFDYVIGGDQVNKGKPDPEIYLKTLNHYGYDKNEAIIFEDAHNGSLSAFGANIDLVIVPNSNDLTDEDLNKAYRVYKTIDQAIELF